MYSNPSAMPLPGEHAGAGEQPEKFMIFNPADAAIVKHFDINENNLKTEKFKIMNPPREPRRITA
jgi:hypothetical protein